MTDISSSKLCVCGSQSNSLRFKVTPKKIGKIPITVKAISTNQNVCSKERKMADSVNAADAVRKMLLVEVFISKFFFKFSRSNNVVFRGKIP